MFCGLMLEPASARPDESSVVQPRYFQPVVGAVVPGDSVPSYGDLPAAAAICSCRGPLLAWACCAGADGATVRTARAARSASLVHMLLP